MTPAIPVKAPAPNEIEVSLFGPGYGESVLLHIGCGKWIIVDSCINPVSKEPAPLSYLKSIGVDVSSAVIMVVASHWHDDHVRGLSRILEECATARFVCPGPLVNKDFVMLGEAYSISSFSDDSGVTEFHRIHSLLNEKNRIPMRIQNCTSLQNLSRGTTGLPFDVKVFSLSPNDTVVESFVNTLLKSITSQGRERRLSSLAPNDTSVVMQVIAGSDSILLGSDMENSTNYGWAMILSDNTKPSEISHAFKVTHHGSATGHDNGVWSKMLHEKPYAFLTPFRRGNKRLPTHDDVKRIQGLTDKSYITVSPNAPDQASVLQRDVEKTLRYSPINMRKVFMAPGHILYRFTPNMPGSRKIELLNGAIHL